ncbi:MAG: site-specific integrase [Hyphomicrobiales bacterium]|nr:site-specific integrase [Hyphomicrobiales bacterium]
MSDKHTILGGKVHIYKRPESPIWQCSTYLAGRNRRVSTKESSLSKAKDFAEDWYLELRSKKSQGEIKNEKTFSDAARQFEKEYEVMTEGQRNEKYVADHKARLRNHLKPFFGSKGLSEIKPGLVQEYRLQRMQNPPREDAHKRFKVPSRTTLHSEIVTLRQVLKTAVRHNWIESVPDLSMPYRQSSKISHRAWFSPDEYKQLYTATRKNASESKDKPWAWAAAQLHDKVLFLANTGIRPDEATWLEYRDVAIVDDEDTGDTILEIEVRGKRGVGFCKSMPGAVVPFQRMVKRNEPEPIDRLFPVDHKRQFNRILDELNLKFDRDGNRRTLYSLRHSYISFRLMEGADIYQIAKNCRTSVEMIEKHYAIHLKNQIDASAVNVRRSRSL